MPAQSKSSFIVLGLRGWILSYFYSKNTHNSGENDHISKKFKLVLKTIYKKVSPKYQASQTFPSLCYASGNGFLSYHFT